MSKKIDGYFGLLFKYM